MAASYIVLNDGASKILLNDAGALLLNAGEGRPLTDRGLAGDSSLVGGILVGMPLVKYAEFQGVVNFLLTTNNAAGGAVAPSSAFEDADFRVYKNGGDTQWTGTVTVTSPFDSVTGLHQVSIDLSDDDTFFELGADFDVVLVPDETIEGQTVAAIIGSFRVVLPGSTPGVPVSEVVLAGADVINANALAADAVQEIAAAIPQPIPPASQRNLERTKEGLTRGPQRAAGQRNLERDGESQPR